MADAPVTVAEQKAAGVEKEDQISVADQKAGNLSDADRRELEALRAEHAKNAPPDPDAEPEAIYWLTLANGEVIESSGQMTHYRGVPVIAVHPIVEMEEVK